jgi:hypothetical protein
MQPQEIHPSDRRDAAPRSQAEETLAVDPRAELTPSQMVERKLFALLASNAVPASRMLARRASVGR